METVDSWFFPGQQDWTHSRPWLRERGHEFTLFERSRLQAVREWQKGWKKARYAGHNIPEIALHTVPADKLQKSWRARIAKEEARPVGLTALHNHPAGATIGLFPLDRPQPPVNRVISLEDAECRILRNPTTGRSEFFPFVHQWEELDGLHLYKEFPVEPEYLENLVSDHAHTRDENLHSLLHPLTSAPPTEIRRGGGSLANLGPHARTRDAEAFISALMALYPPAMRLAQPPDHLRRGAAKAFAPGLSVRVAEVSPPHHDQFEGLLVNRVHEMENRLDQRDSRIREDSMFSIVHPRQGTQRQTYKEFLLGFGEPDTCLPETTEHILRDWLELESLLAEVDERSWAAVAQLHHRTPQVNRLADLLPEYKSKLEREHDAFLADIVTHAGERRRVVARVARRGVLGLARLALSLARRRNREEVTRSELDTGLRVHTSNMETFRGHPAVKPFRLDYKPRRQNIRFDILQNVLLDEGPLRSPQIWAVLPEREHFRDLTDLEGLLAWCRREGYVILRSDGRYQWV